VYGDVSEKLEAQSVARNMFQLNALTLKELESIQSKHSEPVKAAQRLLNIVMNQSGNGYAFFMDALKLTDQNHVYETIIVDGYKGKSCYLEQVLLYATEVSYAKDRKLWTVSQSMKCKHHANAQKYVYFSYSSERNM